MGSLFQPASILRILSVVAGLIVLSSCGSKADASLQNQAVNVAAGDEAASADGAVQTFAFQSTSNPQPYSFSGATEANTLEKCLFTKPCKISQLPPIGLTTNAITIDSVMERVWSTEPWMTQRIKELLTALPSEYLRLFRPVTGIAIADYVGPSHYWAATGGIYINPSFLWLTQEEKDSVAVYEDERIKKSKQLNFRVKWRYVGQNSTTPILSGAAANKVDERQLQNILGIFAAMLSHELAHANDYLPPHALELLDHQETFADAVYYGKNNDIPMLRISKNLQDKYPIANQLTNLARAYYGGIDSAGYQDWQASDVGFSFQYDGASSLYGHYSKEEDIAMLFEEIMMKEFFSLDREMGFADITDDLAHNNTGCQAHKVRWAQRNRFAAPSVRQRAEYVARQILPEYDFSELFNQLTSSTQLETDWCSHHHSIDISPDIDSYSGSAWDNDDIHIQEHNLQGFHKNIMKDLSNPVNSKDDSFIPSYIPSHIN